MFYLQYKYPENLLGKDDGIAGTYDHVGPFETAHDARVHETMFGPMPSTIVELEEAPEPLMSRTDHISYVCRNE